MSTYDPGHYVWFHDGNPTTSVTVVTDIYSSYDSFSRMSLGEIQDIITEFLEWLKAYEAEDIDPLTIRHSGKSAMRDTISFSYNRPATEDEVALYWRNKEQAKAERRAHLLEQLAEMEDEA